MMKVRIINGRAMVELGSKRKRLSVCPHLGDPVDADERRARMLTPKDWRYCNHPDEPLGDIVCTCAGCGPKCRGYSSSY